MKVIVYHTGYGCDTGCCGHVVEVDGKQVGDFHFDHPGHDEDHYAFARKLVTEALGSEHVADLDWLNSSVIYD